MTAQYRVALVGFGSIGQGYGQDERMARYYKYATHAQVLTDHPSLHWRLVMDINEHACQIARQDWGVPLAVNGIDDLGTEKDKIDILVLSTPPDQRSGLLEAFPNLKAVLFEKPIGPDLKTSRVLVDYCKSRQLIAYVNFWRRADPTFVMLRSGGLREKVGDVQFVFATYGNGLRNNGVHMIDMARMLFGDVVSVQRVPSMLPEVFGPIPEDTNPAFVMEMASGCSVTMMPLAFECYRENGMDIWGTNGRLEIVNEGLTIRSYPRAANRAMAHTSEIVQDNPATIKSSVGVALFNVYNSLVGELETGQSQFCSISSALRNEEIVEAILEAPENGRLCLVE